MNKKIDDFNNVFDGTTNAFDKLNRNINLLNKNKIRFELLNQKIYIEASKYYEIEEELKHNNLLNIIDSYRDIASFLLMICISIKKGNWHDIATIVNHFPKILRYDDIKIELINRYQDHFNSYDMMELMLSIIDDSKKEAIMKKFIDKLLEEKHLCFVIARFKSDDVKSRLFREYKEHFDGIDFSDYLRSLESDELRLSEFDEFSKDYSEFRIDWIAESFKTDEQAISFFEDNFALVDIDNIPYFISCLKSDSLKVKLLDKYYKYINYMNPIIFSIKDVNICFDLLKRYAFKMGFYNIKHLIKNIKDENERFKFLDIVSCYLRGEDIVDIIKKVRNYEQREKLINKYLKRFNNDDFVTLYIYTDAELCEKFLATYIDKMKYNSLVRILYFCHANKEEWLTFLNKYLEYFNPISLCKVIEQFLQYDYQNDNSICKKDLFTSLITRGKEKNCLKMVYNAIALYDEQFFIDNYFEQLNQFYSKENLDVINILYSHNKHLFSTLIFDLLDFNELKNNLNFMDKISRYPNIALDLCYLYKDNKNKAKLFLQMLEYIYKFDINLDQISITLIESLKDSKYDLVIDKLDLDNLDQNLLKILISIFLKEKNIYKKNSIENIILPLMEIDDLLSYEDKYDFLVDNIFNKITKISDIKNCIFNKYFGINIDVAQEMVNQYGISLDKMEEAELDYVRQIKYILELDNEENLRNYYNNASKIPFEIKLTIDQKIKQIFNDNISSSLLSINNLKVIKKVNYLDRVIEFYEPEGEFNILINSLIAYHNDDKIDNYNAFWNENKKTNNHGICCSLVTNQNICSTAPVNDVIVGFDGFSNKSIQFMNSIDIASITDEFDFSTFEQSRFMLPTDLRDYTRHYHNELVLERTELRNDKNQEHNNIQPSYVVLYNTSNQDIINKSIKAAYELGVPIIYINVYKIVKREREEIQKMAKEAIDTLDVDLFIKMIVRRENNLHSFSRDHEEINDEYFPLEEIDYFIFVFAKTLYTHFEANKQEQYFVINAFERIVDAFVLEEEKRKKLQVKGQVKIDKILDKMHKYLESIKKYNLEEKYTL